MAVQVLDLQVHPPYVVWHVQGIRFVLWLGRPLNSTPARAHSPVVAAVQKKLSSRV